MALRGLVLGPTSGNVTEWSFKQAHQGSNLANLQRQGPSIFEYGATVLASVRWGNAPTGHAK
jgi:hypothetical protein